MNDAVAEGFADLHVPVERGAESAVHVANHAQTGLVHQFDHLPVVFGGLERPAVKVEVDRRELGPRDRGPGELHQRLRHGRHFGRGVEVGTRRNAGSLGARLPRLARGSQAAGRKEEGENGQPAGHGGDSFGKGYGHCGTGQAANDRHPPPPRLACSEVRLGADCRWAAISLGDSARVCYDEKDNAARASDLPQSPPLSKSPLENAASSSPGQET